MEDNPFSGSRQERELRTYALLDEIKIPYARIDHVPAMTMEACEDVDKALGTLMGKNLFLCNRQQTVFYLLLMPDAKKFRTKTLSAQLAAPGCPLRTKNIWRSCWTSIRAPSVFWG